MSHHLKKLESAGLLTKERRGMSVRYRVVPEAIHAIARALHIACCGTRPSVVITAQRVPVPARAEGATRPIHPYPDSQLAPRG